MKKLMSILCVALVMALLLAACGGQATNPTQAGAAPETTPEPVKTKLISLSGGASGGAYYAIHGGIAELLNSYGDGRFNAKVEVTSGSQENALLVGSGEGERGMTNSHLADFAPQGTAPFSETLNLKAVATLHASVNPLIVPEDSDIKTIEDIRGKKIIVGPSGAGCIPVFKDWLSLYGMTFDDFEPVYLDLSQANDQLKDGLADGFICIGGSPLPSFVELSLTYDFRIISFDTAKEAEFVEKFPYYTIVKVPGGTYTCEENDAYVIGITNTVVVSADMSDEDAYTIAKILYEHLGDLGTYHASVKSVTQEGLAKAPIAFHPGAEKFYKEVGLQ